MPDARTLVSALTQQLIDLVEPNTRFDRTSLPIVDSEATHCNVTGYHTYSVAFGVQRASGLGKLPVTAKNAGSAAALATYVEHRTEANRAALPNRLRRWLDTQQELPGRALDAVDCFNGAETAGYDRSCSDCSGAGEVQCKSCWGQGNTACGYCHGTGKRKCGSCNGKGAKPCGRCAGSGTVGEHRERRVTNYAANTSHVEAYVEHVTCSSCFGRREGKCNTCHGGEVTCSNCHASGKAGCSTCMGKGKLKCKTCDGTGALHDAQPWYALIAAKFCVPPC